MPRLAPELFVVLWFVSVGTGVAGAAVPAFDADAALRASQAAIGRALGRYDFVRSDGTSFNVSKLSGRPLAINLIFTSCYHTCPTITRQLGLAVASARQVVNANPLAVLTIGFDTVNDTPQRMHTYARERGIDDPDWYFLSADAATIERLSADLGFMYFTSPRGFDHLAQVSVIDPAGRVYAQIYGDAFQPPALIEPLRDIALKRAAATGGLDGLLDRVRLLCTVYDPASGRYGIDNSLIIAVITGVTALLVIAVVIVRAWRQADSQGMSV